MLYCISPPVELFLGFTECHFNWKTIKMIWSKNEVLSLDIFLLLQSRISAVLTVELRRKGGNYSCQSHRDKLGVCSQHFAVSLYVSRIMGFHREAACWCCHGGGMRRRVFKLSDGLSVCACRCHWQCGHLSIVLNQYMLFFLAWCRRLFVCLFIYLAAHFYFPCTTFCFCFVVLFAFFGLFWFRFL